MKRNKTISLKAYACFVLIAIPNLLFNWSLPENEKFENCVLHGLIRVNGHFLSCFECDGRQTIAVTGLKNELHQMGYIDHNMARPNSGQQFSM